MENRDIILFLGLGVVGYYIYNKTKSGSKLNVNSFVEENLSNVTSNVPVAPQQPTTPPVPPPEPPLNKLKVSPPKNVLLIANYLINSSKLISFTYLPS